MLGVLDTMIICEIAKHYPIFLQMLSMVNRKFSKIFNKKFRDQFLNNIQSYEKLRTRSFVHRYIPGNALCLCGRVIDSTHFDSLVYEEAMGYVYKHVRDHKCADSSHTREYVANMVYLIKIAPRNQIFLLTNPLTYEKYHPNIQVEFVDFDALAHQACHTQYDVKN